MVVLFKVSKLCHIAQRKSNRAKFCQYELRKDNHHIHTKGVLGNVWRAAEIVTENCLSFSKKVNEYLERTVSASGRI